MQLILHLRTSGRWAHGLFHRRLFLLVAMELKSTKTGSQRVACSCKERVRMIVPWGKRILAIRVEIRPLPPSLAGERGLGANS